MQEQTIKPGVIAKLIRKVNDFSNNEYSAASTSFLHNKFCDYVSEHLTILKQNLTLLSKEFHVQEGIIDILASDSNTHHIIEVKTTIGKHKDYPNAFVYNLDKYKKNFQNLAKIFIKGTIHIECWLLIYNLRMQSIKVFKTNGKEMKQIKALSLSPSYLRLVTESPNPKIGENPLHARDHFHNFIEVG